MNFGFSNSNIAGRRKIVGAGLSCGLGALGEEYGEYNRYSASQEQKQKEFEYVYSEYFKARDLLNNELNKNVDNTQKQIDNISTKPGYIQADVDALLTHLKWLNDVLDKVPGTTAAGSDLLISVYNTATTLLLDFASSYTLTDFETYKFNNLTFDFYKALVSGFTWFNEAEFTMTGPTIIDFIKPLADRYITDIKNEMARQQPELARRVAAEKQAAINRETARIQSESSGLRPTGSNIDAQIAEQAKANIAKAAQDAQAAQEAAAVITRQAAEKAEAAEAETQRQAAQQAAQAAAQQQAAQAAQQAPQQVQQVNRIAVPVAAVAQAQPIATPARLTGTPSANPAEPLQASIGGADMKKVAMVAVPLIILGVIFGRK